MQLGIADRLRLLSVLPAEGNLVTLKIVRDLKDSLSFSEAEVADCKMKFEGTSVMWDESTDPMKDIPIGERATDVIVERLKSLDSQRKLTLEILPLYERFIPEKA